MNRYVKFTIHRKVGGKLIAYGIVDVPDNWFSLSDDEQREYLVKPITEHFHPGKILARSSRFQKATGYYDDVLDFEFETLGGYIVELESGVWLAPWTGDPGRTLEKSAARLYAGERGAAIALGKTRKFRKFRNAVITAV